MRDANAYNYANTLNWNDLAKGSHTADGSIFAGRWKDAYTGIGRCNMLLQHIGLNKELSAEAVTQMKAQARFLRALYYSVLTTYYYKAPLIVDSPDISQVGRTRTDRAEMIRFIVDELGDIAKILPRTYTAKSDQGRPTAGAALRFAPGCSISRPAPCAIPGTRRSPGRRPPMPRGKSWNWASIRFIRTAMRNFSPRRPEHSSESIFNVEAVANPLGLGHSTDIVMRQYNSAAPLRNFIDSYW